MDDQVLTVENYNNKDIYCETLKKTLFVIFDVNYEV